MQVCDDFFENSHVFASVAVEDELVNLVVEFFFARGARVLPSVSVHGIIPPECKEKSLVSGFKFGFVACNDSAKIIEDCHCHTGGNAEFFTFLDRRAYFGADSFAR